MRLHKNGNYAVELTENNCIDTSVCVTINTVGILENSFKDNFTIYPNPTDGLFSIEFESQQEFIHLKLIDISGKLIYENTYKSVHMIQQEITQPKGIYMIEVSDMKTQKSIIKLVKR